MSENIIVPALGESITEATVSKWIKNQGDQVKEDEPIVELETDKVNVEVPSPAEGVISKINFKAGDTVEVGALLGTISSQGDKVISSEKVVSITKSKKQKKKQDAIKEEKDILIFDREESNDNKKEIEQPLILNQQAEKEIEQPLVLNQQAEKEIEQPLVLDQNVSENKNSFQDKDLSSELSPAVRKIVDEKKIDVNKVQGTGKDGRILKGDLIGLMSQSPQPSERKIKYGSEEIIKMTRLRLTIAKRLKEAQENAAILTTFNEVDMSNIIRTRKDCQENFQKKFSVKLGLMSFFVKACIVGLKNFPAINAEISGDNIVYKNYYNIGFAVGTDRGLVVPVLREADEIFLNILGEHKDIWQAFAVLIPNKTVGVMGDTRTYENIIALRAVLSEDGMTADWYDIPHDILSKCSTEIINKVTGVNRVVYDITSKPPGTIEWE